MKFLSKLYRFINEQVNWRHTYLFLGASVAYLLVFLLLMALQLQILAIVSGVLYLFFLAETIVDGVIISNMEKKLKEFEKFE